VTAVGDATGGAVPAGIPRDVPPGPRVDEMFRTPEDYMGNCESTSLVDPWLRLAIGGTLDDLPDTGSPQVEPPTGACTDASNRYHRFEYVGCPSYVYEVWKGIALSGVPDVHYFAVDGGSYVNEHGASVDFVADTTGKQGLFFFDTSDGLPPEDRNGDGIMDNLGPEIDIRGDWNASGFFFVNAHVWTTNLGPCEPARCPGSFKAPGEPFADDGNAVYDGTEPFVDLEYVDDLDAGFDVQAPGSGDPRQSRGPAIPDWVSFRGIFYTTGDFHMDGAGRFYGSVIALGDGEVTGGSDDTGIFWDEEILGDWPPSWYTMPRVIFTSWRTD
jgi:hypothetical protein